MQQIVTDHNCEQHGRLLYYTLRRLGYSTLIPMIFSNLPEVGLPFNADDEAVWRLCQEKGYILLTGNRRTVDGDSSLELTIRRLYSPEILPVVTIGDMKRLVRDRKYCEQCAVRLAEIVLDLEDVRGTTRMYIP